MDGLVIPGGWAPDFLRRHPSCVSLVREMNGLHKVIGAICHGPWTLIEADVLVLCTGYDFMPGTYIPYTVNVPLA